MISGIKLINEIHRCVHVMSFNMQGIYETVLVCLTFIIKYLILFRIVKFIKFILMGEPEQN